MKVLETKINIEYLNIDKDPLNESVRSLRKALL